MNEAPEPGLCGRCRHCKVVRSPRGSTFFRCMVPSQPKYPSLPVLRCEEYRPAEVSSS